LLGEVKGQRAEAAAINPLTLLKDGERSTPSFCYILGGREPRQATCGGSRSSGAPHSP
jgi:hypothetical protein